LTGIRTTDFKLKGPDAGRVLGRRYFNIFNTYNQTNLIIIKVSGLGNVQLDFLLDTGSEISVIKKDKVCNQDNIEKNNSKNITGISANPTVTLGTVKQVFYLENVKLEHEFQVLGSHISQHFDGILGCDFFIRYNVKIDFREGLIKLQLVPLEENK
jgi:Retroviral aspartyl protease